MRLTFRFENKFINILVFNLLEITLCNANDFNLVTSKFEGKIVGGVGVPIERYPYAAIVFNYGALCAGSILSSWAVLSAAHCFEMNDDVYDMTIHVGGRHKYDSKSVVHYVQHLEKHADYNKAMPFACDIAILFVETPFRFGARVQKAVIANSNRWMRKGQTNFTVTGWGMIRYNGPVSDMGLLMAQLKYVPRDECGRLHEMKFTEDMFCLYGEGKKDTCKGDSGGGVLWNGLLVGIVSHGDGCAGKDKPSVYANVYYFRKWIQYTLNKYYKNFCSPRRKSIGRRNYHKNITVNKKVNITTKIK